MVYTEYQLAGKEGICMACIILRSVKYMFNALQKQEQEYSVKI